TWLSPPGGGLTFSVLLRPTGVPSARLGWLPLLAGLSVVRAIRELGTGVQVALKWPNDVLLGPAQGKCAGILAEADPGAEGGPAVVIGIGLNVDIPVTELPEGATSLHAEGPRVERGELLTGLLRRLLADESEWRAAGGDPNAGGLREAYRRACATLGHEVRVSLPDGSALLARAGALDADGRLVLRERSGATRTVAAGDVVHLRALPAQAGPGRPAPDTL
ncbi:MAG: biotin--[acetyl-CoA-carboxylase] ligase, partial [Actinomycetota bacterium]|nr:biotin--[acetyl-CoA-carboxylase] ligase [Actinomycetota bacterium]